MPTKPAARKSPEKYSIDYWSTSVTEFLMSMHPQKDVSDRVLNKLSKTMGYLEQFGRTLGEPHARKLHGYGDLYELRVQDGSGWYRIFYGYGRRRRGGAVPIGLVHAVVKHEANPPLTDYERAERALAAWTAAGYPTKST